MKEFDLLQEEGTEANDSTNTPDATPSKPKDRTPPEVPSKPKSKITLFVDVPTLGVKHKEVKALPGCTVAELVEKLRQKKSVKGTGWSVRLIPKKNPIEIRPLSEPSLSLDECVLDPIPGAAGSVDSHHLNASTKNSLLDRMKKSLRGSSSNLANSPTLPKGDAKIFFGVDLLVLADFGPPLMSKNHFGVPAFVESAFDFLLQNETHTEGIFRISGSASIMKSYRQRLDQGESIDWTPERDAHNATGLIKAFLREMPIPLLTFDLFEPFVAVTKVKDPSLRIALCRFLISALPKAHRSFLEYLCDRLIALAENEKETKMGINNIATLIGPNIARPRNEPNDHQAMFEITSQATAIATLLFSNYQVLFSPTEDSNTSKFVAVATIIKTERVVFIEDTKVKTVFEGALEIISVKPYDLKIIYATSDFIPEKIEVFDVVLSPDNEQNANANNNGSDDDDEQNNDEISPIPSDAACEDAVETTSCASPQSVLTDQTKNNEAIEMQKFLNNRIQKLESELESLRILLEEERKERQELSQLLPIVMKNQDEMLGLLQAFDRSTR